MKYLVIKSYVLAALLLVSCDAINEMQLQSNSAIAIPFETVIPFRYIKKLVVVDAYLNDSKSVNSFIFDTGAFQSKIEYQLAESLQLETYSKRDNGTAQGVKREIEITSVDTISFSTAKFFNIGAGKLQYDKKSFSPCIAKDGIIGANLIKLAHWKIDYQKQEIYVSKKPFVNNSKSVHYELEFNTSFLSGVPEINIEIDGKVVKDVIFDIGYNGGLIVPYRFADQFYSENSQTLIDQSTSGIFGSKRDTLQVKDLPVKLGEYKTNIPVEFSSLNKALLGNDFLEHFTIYLNYDKNTISLVPNSSVEIDNAKSFIPGILNDSLWIVDRTNPNIPLQIGDALKTINGKRPKEVFNSHCDYFMNYSEFLKTDTLKVETIRGNKVDFILNE